MLTTSVRAIQTTLFQSHCTYCAQAATSALRLYSQHPVSTRETTVNRNQHALILLAGIVRMVAGRLKVAGTERSSKFIL